MLLVGLPAARAEFVELSATTLQRALRIGLRVHTRRNILDYDFQFGFLRVGIHIAEELFACNFQLDILICEETSSIVSKPPVYKFISSETFLRVTI